MACDGGVVTSWSQTISWSRTGKLVDDTDLVAVRVAGDLKWVLVEIMRHREIIIKKNNKKKLKNRVLAMKWGDVASAGCK